ncbi:hypothetical protein Spea_3656 [Shewanella pealeana ATCC 700345]|uniref:Uncharacterized protein n=1 Tax=Shewanella pealeana (strain ATCC 700345 / ANG-SQ1) TaxID=398579 RepID=A8H8T0_SHEPA|nr:hypothetical protein Spea_3656 [Shewanella pealeana ATCC 700345]
MRLFYAIANKLFAQVLASKNRRYNRLLILSVAIVRKFIQLVVFVVRFVFKLSLMLDIFSLCLFISEFNQYLGCQYFVFDGLVVFIALDVCFYAIF